MYNLDVHQHRGVAALLCSCLRKKALRFCAEVIRRHPSSKLASTPTAFYRSFESTQLNTTEEGKQVSRDNDKEINPVLSVHEY
jgi:hypothetical protein